MGRGRGLRHPATDLPADSGRRARHGACCQIGRRLESGPPEMLPGPEFVRQRPSQPCSVEHTPGTRPFGNRLHGARNASLHAQRHKSRADVAAGRRAAGPAEDAGPRGPPRPRGRGAFPSPFAEIDARHGAARTASPTRPPPICPRIRVTARGMARATPHSARSAINRTQMWLQAPPSRRAAKPPRAAGAAGAAEPPRPRGRGAFPSPFAEIDARHRAAQTASPTARHRSARGFGSPRAAWRAQRLTSRAAP